MLFDCLRINGCVKHYDFSFKLILILKILIETGNKREYRN